MIKNYYPADVTLAPQKGPDVYYYIDDPNTFHKGLPRVKRLGIDVVAPKCRIGHWTFTPKTFKEIVKKPRGILNRSYNYWKIRTSGDCKPLYLRVKPVEKGQPNEAFMPEFIRLFNKLLLPKGWSQK